MRKTILILSALFLLSSFCFGQDKDILDFALKNPRNSQVQNPDGTWRTPKYGDYKLEQAVEILNDYERPWTVEKVLKWYQNSKNEKERASFLRVLAVSRDVRAAIVLGNALEDESLDVRISAVYGLMDYFVEIATSGGSEQHFIYVKQWWEKNKERLQKEAKKLNK